MNIIFTINNTYVIQLFCTIISILENNKDNCEFYVLHSDVTKENQEKFLKLKDNYKNFNIHFIKIDDSKVENLPRNISYISKECYYRYLIADIIKEDKALYLDADIVVNGNIKSFYDADINNYFCAGVKDRYIENIKHKSTINFSDDDLYINAGVLLLNLQKIREFDIINKLIQNTIDYQKIIKFQDQDILNITFKNKILEVDSIYNFASENMTAEKNKIKKAVIIHYTGPFKPWMDNHNRQLACIWLKYYNKAAKILKIKKNNKTDIRDICRKLLQNIFSVYNHEEHKIICILGIKIKLKK